MPDPVEVDRDERLPRLTPGALAVTAGAGGLAVATRTIASGEDSPATVLLFLLVFWCPVVSYVGTVALVRPVVGRLARSAPGLPLATRAALADLASRRSSRAVWLAVAAAATLAGLLVAAASWADVSTRAAEVLPITDASPGLGRLSPPMAVLLGLALGLAVGSVWVTTRRPAGAALLMPGVTTLLGSMLGTVLAAGLLPIAGIGAGWVPLGGGSPVHIEQGVVVPWPLLMVVLVGVVGGAGLLARLSRCRARFVRQP